MWFCPATPQLVYQLHIHCGQFAVEQKLPEGADKVYAKDDPFIPGARALEPLFQTRLFVPVEV